MMLRSSLPKPSIARLAPAFAALLVLVALSTVPTPSHAAKEPVRLDEMWTSPELAKREIRSVAVLPAFTGGALTPYHPLSDELAAAFMKDGRRWVTPLSSWQALGASEPERVKFFSQLSSEVRSNGHPKKATAVKLADMLGVDAVMLIRVDRWERVSDASDVTTVEAHTELVTADGAPMWKISGRSNIAISASRPRSEMPKPNEGNTVMEITRSGGGSGSNNSSGGTPVSGSAGTGGESGSGGSGSGGSNSTPPAPPVQKFQHEETSAEDLMRISDKGQPDISKDTFKRATVQLVSAWAEKRPAAFVETGDAEKSAASGK